jgi:hypothetical protein
MKKLIFVLILLMSTSCGVSFKISTLNTPTQSYVDENYFNDIKIDTLNEFQFRNKLRNDLGFRLDFAKYALSQRRSFDWNNRLLGRQYDPRYNSYYWNRTQMWNDWAWGYTGWNSWGSPHRWSPFGYDRWGYGIHYGWNNHGWSYGWNNYYGNYNQGWPYWNNNVYGAPYWRSNRQNTSHIYGRRGRNGRAQAAMIESSRRRTNVNTKPNNTRIVKEDNKEILILKDRNGKPVIIKQNNPNKPKIYDRREIERNSNNNIRSNSRNSNNNIRNNRRSTQQTPPRNTRPVINNTRPVIRNNNSSPRNNTTNQSRGRKSSGGSNNRR